MTYGKRRLIVRNGQVFDDNYGSAHTAQEYIEPDQDTWTGLYDHEGTPLHRQREPIGYNPHRWSAPMPSPSQKMKKSKPMKKGKGKGC